MRRENTESLTEVLQQVLRQNGLEKRLQEQNVIDAWNMTLGNTIQNYTKRLSMHQGILYVQLTSSTLRQELFLCKARLIQRLNEVVGAKIVNDIHFN